MAESNPFRSHAPPPRLGVAGVGPVPGVAYDQNLPIRRRSYIFRAIPNLKSLPKIQTSGITLDIFVLEDTDAW